MPSVAHQAFQKTGVYNTNTISAGRPSNAIPRPPLPTIVGFGQNEHSGNNKKRPYHETDKMIKAENKAENQICGVNMPSVAHQAFQKTGGYNTNTISAGRPSNAIPRPPLPTIVRLDQNGCNTNNYTHPNYGTYKMIKTENSAGNRNFGVNMPSVAHQAFQKTGVYNTNTISAGRRNNEIPRPPLPPIVGLGQNGCNTNNYTHPNYGTYKMIKTENSAGNRNFRVNMPSLTHQAFQKTAVYNTNTISAGRPSNEIPRPPLPTIVGLGQNEHRGNNEIHPYHGTDKIIKAVNKAENQICGVNMPSVAYQAFQKTAVYNPNTISAGRPSNAIPRPPLPTIVRLDRNNEGTSTNASLSFKQPIQDTTTMNR
ncbi:hypothetical protein T07_11351 [Trichinella nelsoni]|uniref:Uncharacterized protein n=1 Tax=Trichinella nelsoni TaxID=6336 RepID=A0A0V0RP42_9BILA|nr:hypothetical protein T07_11351 [Trichinella nelsoni]